MKTNLRLCLLGCLFLLPALATRGADPSPPKKLVIEALVDGPSELRVKKDGIYWINGENAKPGRHEGQEQPTYVNGKPWRPNWKNSRATRGADKSAVRTIQEGVDPAKLTFNLLAVGISRDSAGIEKRDEIRVNKLAEELSILIPDSQGGARWYRFELVQQP